MSHQSLYTVYGPEQCVLMTTVQNPIDFAWICMVPRGKFLFFGDLSTFAVLSSSGHNFHLNDDVEFDHKNYLHVTDRLSYNAKRHRPH